jgi:hypothetical protein
MPILSAFQSQLGQLDKHFLEEDNSQLAAKFGRTSYEKLPMREGKSNPAEQDAVYRSLVELYP